MWTYTTFAASLSGTPNVAAHQIIINFFLLFCVFADVLSQMSQSYLPPFLNAHKKSTMTSSSSSSISTSSPSPLYTSLLDKNKAKEAEGIETSQLFTAIQRIGAIAAVVGTVNTIVAVFLTQVFPQVEFLYLFIY